MENIKNDLYYLSKIVVDLRFMNEHVKGMTIEQLYRDEVLLDSIMFRLIQVSQNADKLSEEFKNKHPDIPWRAIKGLRNRIVHEYGNIDLTIIYETVTQDIKVLLEKIKKYI